MPDDFYKSQRESMDGQMELNAISLKNSYIHRDSRISNLSDDQFCTYYLVLIKTRDGILNNQVRHWESLSFGAFISFVSFIVIGFLSQMLWFFLLSSLAFIFGLFARWWAKKMEISVTTYDDWFDKFLSEAITMGEYKRQFGGSPPASQSAASSWPMPKTQGQAFDVPPQDA